MIYSQAERQDRARKVAWKHHVVTLLEHQGLLLQEHKDICDGFEFIAASLIEHRRTGTYVGFEFGRGAWIAIPFDVRSEPYVYGNIPDFISESAKEFWRSLEAP